MRTHYFTVLFLLTRSATGYRVGFAGAVTGGAVNGTGKATGSTEEERAWLLGEQISISTMVNRSVEGVEAAEKKAAAEEAERRRKEREREREREKRAKAKGAAMGKSTAEDEGLASASASSGQVSASASAAASAHGRFAAFAARVVSERYSRPAVRLCTAPLAYSPSAFHPLPALPSYAASLRVGQRQRARGGGGGGRRL